MKSRKEIIELDFSVAFLLSNLSGFYLDFYLDFLFEGADPCRPQLGKSYPCKEVKAKSLTDKDLEFTVS